MRIVKLGVWLLMLYLLQTVFGRLISIYGAVPSLVAVFSVMFSFLAPDDKEAAYITIISALLAGSCTGHSFPFEVLLIGCGSVAARGLAIYFKHIPRLIRLMVIVMIFTAMLITGGYYIAKESITVNALIYVLLPQLIYTMACAIVMYPIMIKTLFKQTEKRLLLI